MSVSVFSVSAEVVGCGGWGGGGTVAVVAVGENEGGEGEEEEAEEGARGSRPLYRHVEFGVGYPRFRGWVFVIV